MATGQRVFGRFANGGGFVAEPARQLLELFLLRLLEGGAGGQLRQLVVQAIDLAGECLEPALGLLIPGSERVRRPALPG